MKIRHKRLAKLLKPHRFTTVSRSPVSHGWHFVRSSHIPDLFESIIVESQGKRGEAVSASVGIAVTQTVMEKVLGNVQILEDMAGDPRRGWTIIDDDSDAREWEQKLATIGPVRAARWADSRGPELLQSTAPLRAIVNRYEECLPRHDSLSQSLALLKRNLDHATELAAERFSESPLFDVEGVKALCYQVACHLITSQSAMIESRSFIGHEPDKDSELPDRIEWLADRLFQISGAEDTVW